MTWLFRPAIFMWVIAALFAASAIRYAFAGDWANVAYGIAAAAINVSVISMGGK